jgi:hypothetical protein
MCSAAADDGREVGWPSGFCGELQPAVPRATATKAAKTSFRITKVLICAGSSVRHPEAGGHVPPFFVK